MNESRKNNKFHDDPEARAFVEEVFKDMLQRQIDDGKTIGELTEVEELMPDGIFHHQSPNSTGPSVCVKSRVMRKYFMPTVEELQALLGLPQSLGAAFRNVGRVRKSTPGTIPSGKALYLTGEDRPNNAGFVEPCDSSQSEKMPMLGISAIEINETDIVEAVTSGIVRGIDTSGIPYGEAWKTGEAVWCGSNGDLTNTKPSPGAARYAQVAAIVGVVDQADGSLVISPFSYSRDPGEY